jgi:hypothetical protein
VKYFLINTNTKLVYAVGNQIPVLEECFIFEDSGHHILKISETDENTVIFPVDLIKEKVIYMHVGNNKYVTVMPNRFGHGVFK